MKAKKKESEIPLTRLKVGTKPKKDKKVTVEVELTYPVALEIKEALDVYFKKWSQTSARIWLYSQTSYREMEKFTKYLTKVIEQNKGFRLFPNKRFTMKIDETYGRVIFVSLMSLIKQADCTNHAMVAMKKHDANAFKSLDKLYNKLRQV